VEQHKNNIYVLMKIEITIQLHNRNLTRNKIKGGKWRDTPLILHITNIKIILFAIPLLEKNSTHFIFYHRIL